MFEITKEYAGVKGFNVQPDWGRNGPEIWLNFDELRYEKMIRIGKECFPSMNTVRIWLSFDAWMQNNSLYLKNVKKAGEILTRSGLQIIPTYFNGWFGVPPFGGFTRECIQPNQIPPYLKCLKETVAVLADANILIHDISNEPFNNVYGNKSIFDDVLYFLKEATKTLREADSRKITIGTQSYQKVSDKSMCDIDAVAPLVDVFSMHPYNVWNKPIEEFDADLCALLEYMEKFEKPVIITECCWAAPTAKERASYLQSELKTYKKYNIGFLACSLFTSPVADLHPVEQLGRTDGLYMAFLDADLNIRPYHDIFNDLF